MSIPTHCLESRFFVNRSFMNPSTPSSRFFCTAQPILVIAATTSAVREWIHVICAAPCRVFTSNAGGAVARTAWLLPCRSGQALPQARCADRFYDPSWRCVSDAGFGTHAGSLALPPTGGTCTLAKTRRVGPLSTACLYRISFTNI